MPNIVYLLMLIPLGGMAYGFFRDYLEFKAKHDLLGVSEKKLQGQVDTLKAENDRLRKRVENIETVVTSRLWQATGKEASEVDKARLDIAVSTAAAEFSAGGSLVGSLDEPSEEPSTPGQAERKIERLAEGLIP